MYNVFHFFFFFRHPHLLESVIKDVVKKEDMESSSSLTAFDLFYRKVYLIFFRLSIIVKFNIGFNVSKCFTGQHRAQSSHSIMLKLRGSRLQRAQPAECREDYK